ncbi:MAG: hypothetical protein FJ304_03800 [Planctomycetes bacterium]|nr:hypothetical protein [Planctomycetota bacterium]
MPTGNDCPACGECIGIWAVFRAPLPNRIYCPHCRTRLRYGGTDVLIAGAVVALVALAVAGLAAALWVGVGDPVAAVVASVAVLVLGGAAIEVVFVLLLWYGSYRLEEVNPARPLWDDEDD